MADLRIVDAPEIPTENITGQEKLPTGGSGNYSITLDSVADYTKTKKDLADNTSVDGKVNGVRQELDAHIEDLLNPHQVTKGQIGLGNVDNTADADKPVSNSTQAAIISAVAPKADKTYVDNQLTLKANKVDVYTKAETYTKQESGDLVNNSISTALIPVNSSLDLAKRGIANRYDPSLTYNSGERVILTNGDIVKSTIDGNTNDPNVDMTGWGLSDAYLNTQKLQRENVSVWDFFTSAQLIEYKASPINYDAQPNLQQFFNYISQNDVGVAYCSGDFYTNGGLILGGSTNSGTKTKKIIGNLKLRAKNVIEEMLIVQPLSDFSWTGWVEVVGIGSVAYSSRTCRTGVKIGDAYTASRCKFEKIIARSFYEFGVACPNLTTLTNIGEVRCYDCGSGKNLTNYSLTSAFSNPVNTGVASNLSQYTTIDVDVLPPENLYTNLKVMIGTDYYYVNSVDRVNKKLSLFPWVSSTNAETTLRYVFGGAVLVQGGDSSVVDVAYIDATRCSQILVSTALYAPVVNKIVGQYCGIAISLGLTLSSACVGGACYGLYNEAGDCDFMRVTRANINYTLVGFVASADKFRNISAPRSNDNDISILYDNFEGLTYINGGVYTFNARTNHSAATIALDLTKPSARDVFGYGDTKEIILYASQPKILKQWGYQHKRAVVIGNGLNYRPTGIIKFTAPAGYTVNGQAQVEFSKFNSIAGFDVYLQYDTTNFVVSRQDGALVQVVYDPDPIPATSAITTTVTMTGAVVGDLVQAAFSINNANLRLYAFVSASNTVTVEFRNIAASQIDLPSGTLTVKLV